MREQPQKFSDIKVASQRRSQVANFTGELHVFRLWVIWGFHSSNFLPLLLIAALGKLFFKNFRFSKEKVLLD